ncbi:MAG: DUF1579 domain-containing protein [Planctomycetes bacterium]|nr:DUF1579 domain-containing protein [Planctomycetota bacterium]
MRKTFIGLTCISAAALASILGSHSNAEAPADAKPAAGAPPEMKLPPGWTAADMQACMIAGTPGKMHKRLAQAVGVWQGKSQMWMPGSDEPMKSDCTATITSIMDGHYTKAEIAGNMPGMGPYTGLGLYGFDNVSEQFVATWIDNQSTGMMNGIGTLSADGKTLTWQYTANCPITKKPTMVREVETITGPDTKTLEMYGVNPKTGKEFKMMRIEFTKKS